MLHVQVMLLWHILHDDAVEAQPSDDSGADTAWL